MLALPMLGRPRRHGGSGLSDKERAAFAESIRHLVATGRVCVVRGDATRRPLRAAAERAGAESLEGGGRKPQSRATGEQRSSPKSTGRRPRPQELVFEGDTAHGELDERLLADAKSADSLALLQFTLRQFYDHRAEAGGAAKLMHRPMTRSADFGRHRSGGYTPILQGRLYAWRRSAYVHRPS